MTSKMIGLMSSRLAVSFVATASLVACGGGGAATPADTSAYLSGTAAYGAPLANAAITVQDSSGK